MNDSYDFRDQEPVWVKYLIYVNGGSNKYYECRLDMADDGAIVLSKRWGRRPDFGTGQVQTERHPSLGIAMSVADAQIENKIRKGYEVARRPRSASGNVDEDWS